MKKSEVIEHLCQTVALVFHSQGDYAHASDGFCEACAEMHGANWNYQHQGKTIEYVRTAVIEKLVRDGHKLRMDALTTKRKEK